MLFLVRPSVHMSCCFLSNYLGPATSRPRTTEYGFGCAEIYVLAIDFVNEKECGHQPSASLRHQRRAFLVQHGAVFDRVHACPDRRLDPRGALGVRHTRLPARWATSTARAVCSSLDSCTR